MRIASARLRQSRAAKSSRTRSTRSRRKLTIPGDRLKQPGRATRLALPPSEMNHGKNRHEASDCQAALGNREKTGAKKSVALERRRLVHQHLSLHDFANHRFGKLSPQQSARSVWSRSM